MEKTCILFCNCGGSVIAAEKSEQINMEIRSLDVDVYLLYDFCGIVLNRKDFVHAIDRQYTRKIMIACYGRAVKNLLVQNGLELSGLEVINFKELPVSEISQRLKTDFSLSKGEASVHTVDSGLEVPAWYPVVDHSRCSDCGKCFKFCLFGVYTFTNKQLNVVNPLACKNNCPACGRNCPSSAIIFPRLKENSTLAGAEPGTEPQVKGLASNQDLITTLNQRSAVRRDIFRSGVMEQAEAERRKALDELKKIKKG